MKPKLEFVNHILREIKEKDLHRQLRYGHIRESHITIGAKKLINLCSNDYLGLQGNKIEAGQLQSSSRLVSGNDVSFRRLEKKLAAHKSQKASLVFPTGYMANLGVISALVGKKDLILSDELNHASIIDACKMTGAKVQVYKHNDMEDLAKKINTHNKMRKFVITEGIFSMDGDYANLKQMTEITEKNNAILILDDAHGDFAVGDDGRGTANLFGVDKKIDAYVSSLSKALGSFGGYAAAHDSIIDLCINRSKSFIYTSALPSFLVKMSLDRLEQDRKTRQIALSKNTALLSSGLKKIGYDIKSPTHIIPIIIGKEKKTLDFGRYLFECGVFAQPIRYPTVPKNSARIRVSVTAWISKKQIEHTLSVFEKAGKKFKIF
ncbi:aminotransferase class I/II-fold pyridoxal phosphate-dependent enzyme [Candidatus Nitrosotenuis sp. DW1]|uniref:aminotransferase class I/II-fold pyridoxal phosphate-dependent enzyme n=1 Tax=Candidatus Nitrosotenuis sp. DW1 TaxID=2259672 RepID=UPI0015CCF41F|nr:aminotransferase class I/II-fold pyridoxal phosphate-dependent enzyme [Candidatus Nitrosotenuis sp. DW1]QLH08884.1 pyridoxal phosphate-dependent aminotransferase family protein [Candidatus Nitrosotenuis sp. DW1]